MVARGIVAESDRCFDVKTEFRKTMAFEYFIENFTTCLCESGSLLLSFVILVATWRLDESSDKHARIGFNNNAVWITFRNARNRYPCPKEAWCALEKH